MRVVPNMFWLALFSSHLLNTIEHSSQRFSPLLLYGSQNGAIFLPRQRLNACLQLVERYHLNPTLFAYSEFC